MTAHTLDEIVRSDKAMLPAQTLHRQDDAYQAGTSPSSNVAHYDSLAQHDYFWIGPVPSVRVFQWPTFCQLDERY